MSSDSAEIPLSPARRRLFMLIALAIPVLFLLLAEGFLRFIDAGEEYPLFIRHPQQQDYLLANPQVLKRFFGNPDDAPSMQIETVFFRADKPANGLRFFVQGGSSAAGFPYGFGGSLAGMLEQRLRRSFPDREIEVISTAMSAVNSYTLLEFADEIIEQQPDAVLVYAGHNEYLGILGVGSNFLGGKFPALTRAYLSLRKLHLFQLLEGIFSGLAPGDSRQTRMAAHGDGTMMSRVAAEQHIVFESDLYRRGIEQFRHNLNALVERYTAADIPVYVGTLVSNEKGQPPFNSGLQAATDVEEWRSRYAAAKRLTDTDAKLAAVENLVNLDDASAAAWFLLGETAYASGDYERARAAYQAARDRDELRFRAPGVFNEIIRKTAVAGARIVDVESALRSEAEHGILDKDLVLEHVHPSLRGYFLLADAYFDTLIDDGLTGALRAKVDDVQAWKEVPVSEVDRLFAEYKIARITSSWPFSNTAQEPQLPSPDSVPAMLAQELYRQTSDWPTVHRRLAEHYQSVDDKEAYAKVSLILADAFPFNTAALTQAGNALFVVGRNRQALSYLYRAAQQSPRDIRVLLALSQALERNGARDQAREVLYRVLALDPGNVTARRAVSRLER